MTANLLGDFEELSKKNFIPCKLLHSPKSCEHDAIIRFLTILKTH